MKFNELSIADIAGATAQWKNFLTGELGFDRDVKAEVSVQNDKATVQWNGCDKFQVGTAWDRKVGELRWKSYPFKLDADWDEVCRNVWDQLQHSMRRDEREMRHAMASMGHLLEGAAYESVVGKLVAERIRSIRDDVTKNLIEFQQIRKVAS